MSRNWRNAVADCLIHYRAAGFFVDDRFADAGSVCADLNQQFDLDSEAEFFDGPELWYGTLLTLETTHCVEMNLKKAGAESGPGYYRDLVHRVFAKISEPDSTSVTEKCVDGGIIQVELKTQLRADWRPEGAPQLLTLRQNFAPLLTWSDFIFLHSMLDNALRERVSQVLHRMGTNEEDALLIFPPSADAEKALHRYEVSIGLDQDTTDGRSEPLASAGKIPQPTAENLSEIADALALTHLPDDEVDLNHLSSSDLAFPDPDAPKPWFSRITDIATVLAWAFAAVMVVRLIDTLLFAEPYCYPFEVYLPESNECAVECLPGESQGECDARAKTMIDAYEAQQ